MFRHLIREIGYDSTEVSRRRRNSNDGMVADRVQLTAWTKDSRDGDIHGGRPWDASAYPDRRQWTAHAFARLERSASIECAGGGSGAWLGTIRPLHDSHSPAIDRRLPRPCAGFPRLRR